jgi:hypothetical protein
MINQDVDISHRRKRPLKPGWSLGSSGCFSRYALCL